MDGDFMRAVIYARYSSDQQREESVDAQIRACSYYAQREGLDVVGQYVDRAKSGMYHVERRTGYADMLAAASRREFDTIIVHSLSRFGRNTTRALDDIDRLKSYGVRVVSVRETLEQSPEGQLMLTIIAGMNEYFSLNLAKEVRKGQLENVYQGRSTGGKPLFGYGLTSDLHYTINETEAVGVRLAFARFLAGDGYLEIARALNDMGLHPRSGQPFGRNSIYSMLTNQRYIGNAYYGRQRNNHGARGNRQEDMVVVEGVCPAIIDKTTWERVQLKMADRKANVKSSAEVKELYILTGKLYCGLCGSKLVGASRKGNGGIYRYYKCNRKERVRDCDLPAIRKDKIEAEVIAQLSAVFADEEKIDAWARALLSSMGQDNGIVAALEKNVKDIDRRIENVIEAISEGVGVARMKVKLADLEQQRETVLQQIAATKTTHELTLDEVKDYVRHFLDLKNLTPAQQREIIQAYVTRIDVYPDDTDPTDRTKKTEKSWKIKITIAPASPPGGVLDNLLGLSAPHCTHQFINGVFHMMFKLA
jgi:site-specific DNA recombinase